MYRSVEIVIFAFFDSNEQCHLGLYGLFVEWELIFSYLCTIFEFVNSIFYEQVLFSFFCDFFSNLFFKYLLMFSWIVSPILKFLREYSLPLLYFFIFFFSTT